MVTFRRNQVVNISGISTEEANNSFIGELQRFIPKPGVAELYRMVIKDIFSQQSGSQSNGRKELLSQIEAENNRLAKARKLLLDDAIDSRDYKTIKMECEKKPLILEGKLTGFSKPAYDIEGCVDKALNTLSRLNTTYLEADITTKRNIIGSIYPEKLSFDGSAYRTARVNEAAHLICLINSKLTAKKIGQNLIFQACPIR